MKWNWYLKCLNETRMYMCAHIHTHTPPQHCKTFHNHYLEIFKIQIPPNFLSIIRLHREFWKNKLQIYCSYQDQEKLPVNHQISSKYSCYYCYKSKYIFKRVKVSASELLSQTKSFFHSLKKNTEEHSFVCFKNC